MPRPILKTPTLRVHAPSGRAFVEVRGKRRYLGPAGAQATQEQYELVCSEIKANGGYLTPPSDQLTILALSVYALGWAKLRYAKRDGTVTSSYSMCRRSLALLVKYHGDELARDFTKLKLKTIRERLLDDGAAQRTVQKVLIYIKLAFQWASESELVADDQVASLMRVRGPRANDPRLPEPQRLTPANPDDVARTLPFLSPTLRAMVQLQELTGMRAGEVCRLTPGQIDRSSSPWRYLPHEHKMKWKGKARKIPLGPKCQAILAPFLLRSDESPCFNPRESVKWFRTPKNERTESVAYLPPIKTEVTDRRRKPKRTLRSAYSSESYSRAIARVCEAEGIPAWSPIQLRKLRATLTEREHGAIAAARLLGHSSARITEEHYIERDDEDLMRLAL